MRKISMRDDEQRATLLELIDFGIAAFWAGLVVAVHKGNVDLAR
jgi:hypothetical protein